MQTGSTCCLLVCWLPAKHLEAPKLLSMLTGYYNWSRSLIVAFDVIIMMPAYIEYASDYLSAADESN